MNAIVTSLCINQSDETIYQMGNNQSLLFKVECLELVINPFSPYNKMNLVIIVLDLLWVLFIFKYIFGYMYLTIDSNTFNGFLCIDEISELI